VSTEDSRVRPAWLDSTAAIVVLVAATAMWAFYMVVAIAKGAYALAAVDALLLVASVWTVSRILRRRRAQRRN
jgi:membrane protein YdbS with pleckstrin-like domain